jgi:hypothetical protein
MVATITALAAMIALVAVFSASTGDLIAQARMDRSRAVEANLRKSAQLWAREHPAEASRGRGLDVSTLGVEQAEVSVKQTDEAVEVTGEFTIGSSRVRLDGKD